MALAVIELEDADERQHTFRVDVGKNQLFSYAIGDGKRPLVLDGGFALMAERSYESPLQEVPPSALGRTVIGVPSSFFEDESGRDIQLLSFREQRFGENVGPAVSDILRVRPRLRDLRGPAGFALAVEARALETAAFRDEAEPLSTAMFLDFLSGLVSKLLPVVTNVLSSPAAGSLLTNMIGSLAPSAAPAGGAPAAPLLESLGKPENAKLLVELVQKLLAGVAATPAESRSLNGAALGRNGGPPAHALEPEMHLAHAQWVQAALALLPMLQPLLQSVLTPDTVKSLISMVDPTKILGVISGGLQELAKIGLEGTKQQLEHLEKINPGTATPDLIQLLTATESLALARTLSHEPYSKPDFTRVESVRLAFAEIGVQTVAGRPQACFVADRELKFPITVETPRPLRKAALHLHVKDAASLRVLVRRSYPLEDLVTGRLAVVPSLRKEEVVRLGRDRELLVCASLVWKGKGGRRLGTSMIQLVSLVGPLAFDRVEQTTEVLPLNDVERHRDFWHKAWQGTFDREHRKVVFNCKYHYALDPRATANAQMETVTETEPGLIHQEVGRLKSGLVSNLFGLNRLIGQLSSERPLDEAELEALKARDFTDRFSQAARTQVTFRGRPGDSAALWVYPEVKLQRIVLRSADEVNDAGHVVRFGEREVRFPMPVLAHFIGVASQ